MRRGVRAPRDDDRARDRIRDDRITTIIEKLADINARLGALERIFSVDHVSRSSFEAVVRRVDTNGKRLDGLTYIVIGQFIFLFVLVVALFAAGVF